MAEALANKLNTDPNVEFISAGTLPAKEVNPNALAVLRGEGIVWAGRPKAISEIGDIDQVVTMGCEVACPTMPGVEVIEWDISDPIGGDIGVYRKTLKTIRDNVEALLKEVD